MGTPAWVGHPRFDSIAFPRLVYPRRAGEWKLEACSCRGQKNNSRAALFRRLGGGWNL